MKKIKLPDMQKIIQKSIWARLGISLAFDILDSMKLPILAGPLSGIIGTALAINLWGNNGALASWEILELSDTLDRFIPSVTLTGILSILRGKK